MPEALHHLHKRKRIHEKLEQYPNPNKIKQLMDKVITTVGVFGPIMTFPQVYKIWVYQNAESISLFTFCSHVIFNLLWLTYGIIHKEKPIIIVYILWFLANLSIVVGTLLYG